VTKWHKSGFVSTFGPVATLTFDLLTEKSNKSILVSSGIWIVNVVKVLWSIYKISCSQGHTNAQTDRHSSSKHLSNGGRDINTKKNWYWSIFVSENFGNSNSFHTYYIKNCEDST